MPAAIALGHEVLDVERAKLVAGVAEELLGLTVHHQDCAVFIGDDHGVGRRFEQIAELGRIERVFDGGIESSTDLGLVTVANGFKEKVTQRFTFKLHFTQDVEDLAA